MTKVDDRNIDSSKPSLQSSIICRNATSHLVSGSVNDIIMGRLMKIPEDIFNNYGSSIVFGHPQGPTGARCTIELIEELIKLGGGFGLFAGCAAGDTAAALVLKIY